MKYEIRMSFSHRPTNKTPEGASNENHFNMSFESVGVIEKPSEKCLSCVPGFKKMDLV